ncbi:MAG: hypothetical protein ABI557_11690 [Aureliella sp.]
MTVSEIQSGVIAEDFIKQLKWSDDTPEEVRSAVASNIRCFWQWMHSQDMEGCQAGVDEAMSARFREGALKNNLR